MPSKYGGQYRSKPTMIYRNGVYPQKVERWQGKYKLVPMHDFIVHHDFSRDTKYAALSEGLRAVEMEIAKAIVMQGGHKTKGVKKVLPEHPPRSQNNYLQQCQRKEGWPEFYEYCESLHYQYGQVPEDSPEAILAAMKANIDIMPPGHDAARMYGAYYKLKFPTKLQKPVKDDEPEPEPSQKVDDILNALREEQKQNGQDTGTES